MSQYYNLRSTINSALKCRSHKNRLFSSILFFKSGVISLVRKPHEAILYGQTGQ